MTIISFLHRGVSSIIPDDVIKDMTVADLAEAVKSAPCERQSQEEDFELLMPMFKIGYNFGSVKDVLDNFATSTLGARSEFVAK